MTHTQQTPPERRATAVVIPFPYRARDRDIQTRLQNAIAEMETGLANQLKEARGFQAAARKLEIVMRDLGATLRGYKRRLHFVESELGVTTARSRYLADLMGDWAAAAERPA